MRKKRFYAILVGAVSITAVLMLASCVGGAGGSGETSFITLSNFQNASMVLGKPDFTTQVSGTLDAKEVESPYGNPMVQDGVLFLSDYDNNRVLGFDSVPTENYASADFVLGQPDFSTNASGTAADKMDGPQTVLVSDGKLLIVDYNNNRVLIWNTVPTTTGGPADVVVGWPDFGSPISGCTASTFFDPEGIFVANGRLIVADSGNNRVFIFNTIPSSNGASADIVLGQGDFVHGTENDDDQDGTADTNPTARTLYYPTDVWSNGSNLVVTDNDNNRVLIWNSFPTASFTPADVVLGQNSFTMNAENDDDQDGEVDTDPTARTLYWPYYLASNGTQLLVTDSMNNRVLIWNSFPTASFTPADVVLGQNSFTMNARNDDDQNGASELNPTARTLSYPVGLYLFDNRLIVTDCLNDRYLIFQGQ